MLYLCRQKPLPARIRLVLHGGAMLAEIVGVSIGFLRMLLRKRRLVVVAAGKPRAAAQLVLDRVEKIIRARVGRQVARLFRRLARVVKRQAATLAQERDPGLPEAHRRKIAARITNTALRRQEGEKGLRLPVGKCAAR